MLVEMASLTDRKVRHSRPPPRACCGKRSSSASGIARSHTDEGDFPRFRPRTRARSASRSGGWVMKRSLSSVRSRCGRAPPRPERRSDPRSLPVFRRRSAPGSRSRDPVVDAGRSPRAGAEAHQRIDEDAERRGRSGSRPEVRLVARGTRRPRDRRARCGWSPPGGRKPYFWWCTLRPARAGSDELAHHRVKQPTSARWRGFTRRKFWPQQGIPSSTRRIPKECGESRSGLPYQEITLRACAMQVRRLLLIGNDAASHCNEDGEILDTVDGATDDPTPPRFSNSEA